MNTPKIFNLANSLSLLRILGVPVILVLLYFGSRSKFICLLTLLLFMLIAFTDMVDGFVARKFNQITNLGKFLDPLADKILVNSILIMLTHLGRIDPWITIIIIIREIIVTGLRAIAAERGKVIAADIFGKVKTILQMLALCPLLLHHSWFGFNPVPLGTFVLWLALFATIFSGCNYLRNSYKVLRD